MREIVKMVFGSHLYGTATPASDRDFKAAFIPPGRDILLQRAARSVSVKRPKAQGEKNYAGEEDTESYGLQYFLKLASEGQTVALDMLFAPDWALVGQCAAEWHEIIGNRHRLLTSRSASFIGYAKRQASKYGIKGSRVAAARLACDLLQEELAARGTTAKLGECEPQLTLLSAQNEHMALLDIEGATDVSGVKRTVRHWEVCARKMPLTQTIKTAHEVMRRIVEEYGHRARQAESNQGVDWKALSHAVRVGTQAIELLRTGFVTFPRPDAALLVAIKLGERPYQEVAERVENLLAEVEIEAARSTLPESADLAWIDDFVAATYRDAILW